MLFFFVYNTVDFIILINKKNEFFFYDINDMIVVFNNNINEFFFNKNSLIEKFIFNNSNVPFYQYLNKDLFMLFTVELDNFSYYNNSYNFFLLILILISIFTIKNIITFNKYKK